MTPTVQLIHGDCLDVLRTMPDASVDAAITDPPYPCIKRSYGVWTESEWHSMMDVVVSECRRILKPTGSAVFILQPNSERVGRMRTWLWEFMAKWGKAWGIVQDAYWWNYNAMPEAHAIQGRLMRPSVKACVWLGAYDCHRNQDDILWMESEGAKALRIARNAAGRIRNNRESFPSGQGKNEKRMRDSAELAGGVTPYNILPFTPDAVKTKTTGSHGATTPSCLARWWTRYICPSGGTVLDPFSGSGTMALAALSLGRSAIGIERNAEYHAIAQGRIAAAQAARAEMLIPA